jgi:glycosyltransferase involved in cell wall biosynthesis/2-polyprenyl-3-methyl-5-hydroxy-6-metoxy-1,4-benzoquinol methylase
MTKDRKRYDYKLDIDHKNTDTFIIDQVENNKKVLEFGPSFGKLTKYLTNNKKCIVDIVEIDKDAVEVCKKYARKAICDDIENYKWIEELSGQKYDYIIFEDVLEHLKNPGIALVNIKDFLKKSGKILITVPNISFDGVIYGLIDNNFTYSMNGILDSTHLKFFTYESVLELINSSGFSIINETAFYHNVNASEFSQFTNDIPMEIQDFIKTKKHHNIYQYGFCISSNDSLSLLANDKIDRIYDKEQMISSLYIDIGNGYNENDSVKHRVNIQKDGTFYISYDISRYKEIKCIRWDPHEKQRIKCKILSIFEDGKPIEMIPLNSYITDGVWDTFNTLDPNYSLKITTNRIQKIEIMGELSVITLIDLNLMELKVKRKEIEKLNEKTLVLEEKIELLGRNNQILLDKSRISENNIQSLFEQKRIYESLNKKHLEQSTIKEEESRLYKESLDKLEQDLLIQQKNNNSNLVQLQEQSKEQIHEIENLRGKNVLLENEKTKLINTNKTTTNNLQKAMDDIDRINNINQGLVNDNNTLSNEISRICDEKIELVNANEITKNNLQKVMDDIDSILNINQGLVNNNNILSNEISGLRDEKAKLYKLNEEYKKHKKEQLGHIVFLENKLDNVSDQIHELEQKIYSIEKINNDLESLNYDLKEKYKFIETEYLAVMNSVFWRSSKHIRRLFDLLKGIKRKYNISTIKKGIKFIKQHGLKHFFIRTKAYIKQRSQKIDYENKAIVEKQHFDEKHTNNENTNSICLNYREVFVSIIIPTYNGGIELKELIKKLKVQEQIAKIEIIIIDSGSKDGTVEYCKDESNKLIEIKNEDFSHSYARNLGVENASGDYLLFVTQDVKIKDTLWIYDMFEPIMDNEVVAVSSIDVPRVDADLFSRISHDYHRKFLGLYDEDIITVMPEEENHITMRKNAQISDVNCLIRKDIFLDYRYDGDYAEDLLLGINLLKGGYKLGLLVSTNVIHSHNREGYYHLRRAIVDQASLLRILPDFPVIRKTASEIINSIIETDKKTKLLIKKILFENNRLKDISKLIKWLGKVNANMDLSKTKEDEIKIVDKMVDKMVIDITEIKKLSGIESKEEKENIIFDGVIYYTNTMLTNYLLENSKTLKDDMINDIIDAIYKQMCIFIGVELGTYYFLSDAEDELIELINNLRKGI